MRQLTLWGLAACMAATSAMAQQFKSTPIPPGAEPRAVSVSSSLPQGPELLQDAVVLPNSAFVFRQGKGGSAAVGILFGALGVLANHANIQAVSEAEAKSIASFYDGIDVRAMLQAALRTPPTEAARSHVKPAADDPALANRIRLVPYVFMRSHHEELLRSTVTIQAELFGEPDKRIWFGRYHAHVPLMLKVEEVQKAAPEAKQQFAKALEQSMHEALGLFYDDLGGGAPGTGKKVNVISMYLANIDMRRMQIAFRGELVRERDGLKVIRHDSPGRSLDTEVFGLHLLRDAQIMRLIPLGD